MQTALQPRPRAQRAPVTPKKIGPKVNPNKTNTPPPVKKDDRLNDWNDSWVRKHNDPKSCPCLQTSCKVSWMMCVIFWTCLIQHGIQLYMSPQANLFVWGFGSCFCGRWRSRISPFWMSYILVFAWGCIMKSLFRHCGLCNHPPFLITKTWYSANHLGRAPWINQMWCGSFFKKRLMVVSLKGSLGVLPSYNRTMSIQLWASWAWPAPTTAKDLAENKVVDTRWVPPYQQHAGYLTKLMLAWLWVGFTNKGNKRLISPRETTEDAQEEDRRRGLRKAQREGRKERMRRTRPSTNLLPGCVRCQIRPKWWN